MGFVEHDYTRLMVVENITMSIAKVMFPLRTRRQDVENTTTTFGVSVFSTIAPITPRITTRRCVVLLSNCLPRIRPRPIALVLQM